MAPNMWITNGTLLAGMVVASGVFDTSLSLGAFHGVVFTLYLLYASVLLFLGNAIYAFLLHRKDLTAKRNETLLSGFVMSGLGVVIAYAAALVF